MPSYIGDHEAMRMAMIAASATDPITRNNALDSPLLRLPGEIRNIIYRYVLGGHIVNIKSSLPDREPDMDHGHDKYIIDKIKACGPILMYKPIPFAVHSVARLFHLGLVCRQTHLETYLIPYKENTFKFYCNVALMDWTSILSTARRLCITTIGVDQLNGRRNVQIKYRYASSRAEEKNVALTPHFLNMVVLLPNLRRVLMSAAVFNVSTTPFVPTAVLDYLRSHNGLRAHRSRSDEEKLRRKVEVVLIDI